MFNWFKNKPEPPISELPPRWTSDLWDEFFATGQTSSKPVLNDLKFTVRIDSLDVGIDFNPGYGESPKVRREYAGFVDGAWPNRNTRLGLLRASLYFVDRESFRPLPLPAHSGGCGQTLNQTGLRPTLIIEVFCSPENQLLFEKLFVRAKMLHINHLPVSIWAQTLPPGKSGTRRKSLRRCSASTAYSSSRTSCWPVKSQVIGVFSL